MKYKNKAFGLFAWNDKVFQMITEYSCTHQPGKNEGVTECFHPSPILTTLFPPTLDTAIILSLEFHAGVRKNYEKLSVYHGWRTHKKIGMDMAKAEKGPRREHWRLLRTLLTQMLFPVSQLTFIRSCKERIIFLGQMKQRDQSEAEGDTGYVSIG